MESLRLSATDLDAVRYWRDREEMGLDELLARLNRAEPPSAAMLAGRAFHAALESAGTGDTIDAVEAEGITFEMAFEAKLGLPPIREMKAVRTYRIAGCDVTLVGKVDALYGRTIYDHKLTSRFDAERFLASYQWRCYLEIFDADSFVWNVFEGRERAPGRYRITAMHRLAMHRYPGMGEDVTREIAAFVDLARAHLPERLTKGAA